MTLTQITLFFGAILSAIVCAMFIHSWLDKRGIARNLRKLTPLFSGGEGAVIQTHPLVYPCFSGSMGPRQIALFFTVVKVGRQHILYVVYQMTATPRVPLLLIRSGVYKPLVQSGDAVDNMGALLPDMDTRYQVYAASPETARPFFEQGKIGSHLDALSEFTSLQLGPDALVVGKPYDGLSDTLPENLLRNLHALSTLATAMERPVDGGA